MGTFSETRGATWSWNRRATFVVEVAGTSRMPLGRTEKPCGVSQREMRAVGLDSRQEGCAHIRHTCLSFRRASGGVNFSDSNGRTWTSRRGRLWSGAI